MQRKTLLKILLFFSIVVSLASCRSVQTGNPNLYDPVQVSHLSQKLGIPLKNTNKDDDKNMKLYAECSLWMGVKYRYGGTTKRGVDCSGLALNIYKNAYGKSIPRSTTDLSAKVKTISKGSLYAGDLVFFATTNNKKKPTHVGIYLKDGYFIHASTSRGVVVNHLDENYYKKNWLKAGRIR
ncbi:C40 family peptidase [Dysgonomonas sp. 25]|uniref:C40 family peptidase n=1 Tax=Dysgonomonas sp. 25 TaxID=2302933 RepID=UPI0013D3959C|nr:NlpC/P60 family protein [Dysgonomonas sp. 25]NDV68400.1 NlpC/P60 family protein [Dysgonomonas sp. 25]